MLDAIQVDEAARLLRETWNDGALVSEIPSDCRPSTREDAYAIQAALDDSGATPFGWKIAATSEAGQRHINVDGPLAGRLFRKNSYESGAIRPIGANRMLVAEPEFAFRMGVTLLPRELPYSTDEVVAAIGAVHPAIEIPDSRYEDFTKVGAAQLIADDACAREFVLAAAAEADWREIDFATYPVKAQSSGGIDREGSGAAVLGSPLSALTWLVNELSSLDIPLECGQVVTTGTCMAPIKISPGVTVTADFGRLGQVSVRLI